MSARRWLPPILWAALTWTLTSLPHVGRYLPPLFPGADKIVHATLYGVMAWLIARAAAPVDGADRPVLLLVGIVPFVSLFGWIDEWHQQFIPGRSRETADWIADTLGAALAILAVFLIQLAPRRRDRAS